MGASFIRRFTFDPGVGVLLNIESVNILDLTPPASIAGIGTGTVLFTSEFENGPFNTPLELASPTDMASMVGVVGFTYGGVPANYPCAASRKADGALAAEYWNGNGAVQLNGKQFARLIVCRPDTSVGTVQFSPLAYVTGAAAFRYVLAPNQVLSLDVGAGFVSATFTATAATVTSGSQTFPDGFVGGETLVLGYDGAPNFTTTFLSTDTTQVAVIARINQYAGFTFAASVTGTTMSLTGISKGSNAQVRVISGSTGVLTALGLTAATTFGTGNVQNILAVTPQEVKAVVEAAVSGTLVEIDQNNNLRVSNTTSAASSWIAVGPLTTAAALGFTSGQYGSTLGVAQVRGLGGTFGMAASTITLGFDNDANFTTTFAGSETTVGQIVTAVNAAAGKTVAVSDGGQLRLFGALPGGQVRVVSVSASTVLTLLGLTIGTTLGVPLPSGQVIPAGTVVQKAGGPVFVTMQDVAFTASGVQVAGSSATPTTLPTFGPYPVKVRHAVDDGTGLSATAGTVVQVPTPPLVGSFAVTNPAGISAALSESAIDAAYVTALGFTLDVNSVAKQVNISYAGRQSNAVRQGLRANALSASANGCFGRVACIRTPLGITKAVAQSTTTEPGVGATRDQRVFYCWPQASTFVPVVAQRGVAGGAGFTATGNVDIGADGFLASILSQLPPEENPGQDTPFTGGVVGLESSVNAQGLNITDYTNLKNAGICALRMDDGTAIFQSGVTSVDPNVYPQLVRISRRRMADFIQDSLANAMKQYGKKLSTSLRRRALVTVIRGFLGQLLSADQPASQRIDGFTVDQKSGNTAATVQAGLFRVIVNVRTLASLDSIVLQTTIGEQVQVQETLPQAA